MQYFTPGGTASNVQIVAEKYHWVVFAWKDLLYVFNVKRLFPITGYSSVGTVWFGFANKNLHMNLPTYSSAKKELLYVSRKSFKRAVIWVCVCVVLPNSRVLQCVYVLSLFEMACGHFGQVLHWLWHMLTLVPWFLCWRQCDWHTADDCICLSGMY